MGFYYFSFFSAVPLGIAYAVLALAFFGIVHATRRARWRKIILGVVGVVFLLLPIGEELWVAWSFGQACKKAGTFIYKKVQVDGFYDDTRTTRAGTPTPQAVESFEKSGYRFLEMVLSNKKGGPNQVVHFEKTGGQWVASVIDRPTARYHFRNTDPMNGTPWGHKVGRSGSVVIDTETNEEVARYTSFGRRPPWFYIGLGAAPYACDSPGDWPNSRKSSLIYREALVPVGQK